MRSRTIWASLAALPLVTLGSGAWAATPAQAADTCSGVWVVVESNVRCATSYSNGLTALKSAGFAVQQSQPGFICRIDGAPSTCRTAVPYWAYFHSTRRSDGSWGPWVYSQLGATNTSPSKDVAEGWTFGTGDATPPVKPTAAAAASQPTATSKPTRTATSAPPPPATSTSAPRTSTRPPTVNQPTTRVTTPEGSRAGSRPTGEVAQTAPHTTSPATTGVGTAAPAPAQSSGSATAPVVSAASTAGGTPGTAGQPVASSPASAPGSVTAAVPASVVTSAESVTNGTPSVNPASVAPAGDAPSGGSPAATAGVGAALVAGAAGLGGWAWRRRGV